MSNSGVPAFNFGVKLNSDFASNTRSSDSVATNHMNKSGEPKKCVMVVVKADSDQEIAYVVGIRAQGIIEIQQSTNTKIVQSKKDDWKKRFVITGGEEGARKAKEMIQQKLELFRRYHQPIYPKGDEVYLQVEVALGSVGAIIGTRGETVQAIEKQTCTRIKSPARGETPLFEIVGLRDDAEAAKEQILAISNSISSRAFTSAQQGFIKDKPPPTSQQLRTTNCNNYVNREAENDAYNALSARYAELQLKYGRLEEAKKKEHQQVVAEKNQLDENNKELLRFIKEKGLCEELNKFTYGSRHY